MATPVYASMVPLAGDTLQVLLVKAGYYTQVTAEALGAPFNSGMYASMSPNAQDTIHVLAAKLAYWTEQVAAGGGGGGGTNYQLEGHGAPVAAPSDPAKIWTYYDLDNGRQAYMWSVIEQSWG